MDVSLDDGVDVKWNFKNSGILLRGYEPLGTRGEGNDNLLWRN